MKKLGVCFGIVIAGGAFIHTLLIFAHFQYEIRFARKRTQTCSQVITTRFGVTEYTTTGNGYPVLISHASGSGYDLGFLLAEAWVGNEFLCIAPSRFGYLGTTLPSDASPGSQANAYADLLDSLGIKEVAIIGVSGGGPSALQFALKYPRRCAALIMIAAVSHGIPPLNILQKLVLKTIFRSDFIYWIITTNFQENFYDVFGIPSGIKSRLTLAQKDSIAYFINIMHPASLRRAGIFNDQMPRTHDYPIENITVPTLVIHAIDDPIVPFSHAQHTTNNISNAHLFAIQNGGHLMIGQNAKIKAEVVKFLKQIAY